MSEPFKAYYSVIQFMPDAGRCEALNVGVVSYSRGGFPKVKILDDYDHIAGYFGADAWQIKTATEMIATRLADRFDTIVALETFIAERANEIQLTPLRPMRGDMASNSIEELFKALVQPPKECMK